MSNKLKSFMTVRIASLITIAIFVITTNFQEFLTAATAGNVNTKWITTVYGRKHASVFETRRVSTCSASICQSEFISFGTLHIE